MTRESFVFVLGFVVFITSFLGIPGDWKQSVYVFAGILLMIFGYSLRRSSFLRSIEKENGERHGGAFVESVTSKKRKEDTEKAADDK